MHQILSLHGMSPETSVLASPRASANSGDHTREHATLPQSAQSGKFLLETHPESTKISDHCIYTVLIQLQNFNHCFSAGYTII